MPSLNTGIDKNRLQESDEETARGSELRDSRLPDCVAIDKTTHISLIVIPGLTRNPAIIQWLTILDAGSVIPDLIRDRHDGQKLNGFLNGDPVWQAEIRKK